MKAALLALMMLGLLAPDALARLPMWTEKTVRVLDYSTPMWDGMVAGMVEEFNAVLPAAAPRLVYRRMPERSCDELSDRVFSGAIAVCSVPAAPFVGMTGMWTARKDTIDTRIILNDRGFLNERFATNTVCHELMHAVTGIRDKYDRRPKTSCVWGDLPSPGRFDVAYARKVFAAESDR